MKIRRANFSRRVGAPSLALLALACEICSTGQSAAQEALLNSLSYDRDVQLNQNSMVNLQPDQPHLGPVQASLGAYTEVDHDDNINLVQTGAQADTILHMGLSAGFVWPVTQQTALNLNTAVGYAHYLRYSQYDSLEIAPNSAVSWNINFDDGALTFYDQFSYSQSVVSEPALAGEARFPRFDNTVGTRATWTPGQWFWQAGYSHDLFFSDSTEFNYLNHSSELFFTRGAWRFAENTQAGAEASASLTTYQQASQGRNNSLSIGPYAEWQLTPATHLTLRGGPTFYQFDSPGNTGQSSSLGSYYLEFDAGEQLTDYLSHHASVQRNVSLGVNQGSSYLEQLTAGYSIQWAMTPRIELGCGATYEHGVQTFQNPVTVFPGFTVLVDEHEIYDRYSVTPTATWRATEHFTADVNYTHYLRTSNLDGRGYTQNTVALRLTYSF